MDVAVIVPWRPGCPHRERAWEWVQSRYREQHPNFQIVAGVSSFPGPWVKALAATPSIEATDAEIVVVADADVWPEGLQGAVDAVAAGAGWAMPHRFVFRLTEAASEGLIAGEPWSDTDLDRRGYLGVFGGGVVVARRETLIDVPLDPRFQGWGQEDHAWGIALNTLAGKPWRGKANLVHLWHPPQDRLNSRYGSMAGKALWQRYAAAQRRGPEAMRELTKEARSALDSHQPPGDSDPAIGVGAEDPLRGLSSHGVRSSDALRDPAKAA